MKAAPRPAIAMIPEPTRTTAPPTRYRVTGSPSRLGSTRRRAWRESGCRCPEDAPDRCIEGGVELGLALLGGQATGECPGEARDHTVVPGQACVRLLEGVTAGQCDDAQHPRVLRVVALSGGYSLEEANARLARNHGVVARFSRALTGGLSAQQSETEFDAALDAAVGSIFRASAT